MEMKRVMDVDGKTGLALEAGEGERSEPVRAGRASPASGESVGLRNGTPDPEVSEKVTFRRYPAAYKLKILREADRCTKPGETGALLRREGLYSSLLCSWRRQRAAGESNGLAGKKPGRSDAPRGKLAAEVKLLRRENRRLEGKLRRAEVVLDIQKKASELLGIPLNTPEFDESE